MEKLETELAALRARADILSSRHAAADSAFLEAKSKLQRHHLEADLVADDKARAKLEVAVATCAVTRDGYADALDKVQAQIADAEQKINAERATERRKAASEELARDLHAIEQALPDYLESARRLVSVLDAIHWHYESDEMSRFVGNSASQVEVASAFTLQELRGTVNAIRDGVAPIPVAKPKAAPVAVVEAAPPSQTVFLIKTVKFRDHAGKTCCGEQYEDCTLPLEAAQRALRNGAAVSVADPRRAQLRGARGGDYNPRAPDVVDLDASEEPKGVPYIGSDIADPVLRDAHFTVIDRGPERTLKVTP